MLCYYLATRKLYLPLRHVWCSTCLRPGFIIACQEIFFNLKALYVFLYPFTCIPTTPQIFHIKYIRLASLIYCYKSKVLHWLVILYQNLYTRITIKFQFVCGEVFPVNILGCEALTYFLCILHLSLSCIFQRSLKFKRSGQ